MVEISNLQDGARDIDEIARLLGDFWDDFDVRVLSVTVRMRANVQVSVTPYSLWRRSQT